MPDKLTDNKVMKGLKCCAENPCDRNCPYIRRIRCNDALMQDALDLINRLQADCENYKKVAEHQQSVTMDRGFEIKRLKEKIESLQAEKETLEARIGVYETCNARKDESIRHLEAENERLKEKQEKCFYCTEQANKKISEIKAEAYKEFAKKLKHKAINIGVNDSIVSTFAIDETLKELVGDNNES